MRRSWRGGSRRPGIFFRSPTGNTFSLRTKPSSSELFGASRTPSCLRLLNLGQSPISLGDIGDCPLLYILAVIAAGGGSANADDTSDGVNLRPVAVGDLHGFDIVNLVVLVTDIGHPPAGNH